MLWKSLLLIYKIFHRRTCGLSYQIKGPTIVKLAIFLHEPMLASFTIVGPLIWCDNPQVRLSKILYINNNDFHHLGRSQMCAGGCCYFRLSKPHSGTLWMAMCDVCSSLLSQVEWCDVVSCLLCLASKLLLNIKAIILINFYRPWYKHYYSQKALRKLKISLTDLKNLYQKCWIIS